MRLGIALLMAIIALDLRSRVGYGSPPINSHGKADRITLNGYAPAIETLDMRRRLGLRHCRGLLTLGFTLLLSCHCLDNAPALSPDGLAR